jgi:hypothetical protein
MEPGAKNLTGDSRQEAEPPGVPQRLRKNLTGGSSQEAEPPGVSPRRKLDGRLQAGGRASWVPPRRKLDGRFQAGGRASWGSSEAPQKT